MAYQVPTPDKVNSRPQEWDKRQRRFEKFKHASSLDDKEDEAQVNTIIYSMGDEADDILTSLDLSAADKKKYKTVLAKSDKYFIPRKNVIFERAKFNQRQQMEAETVDNFITDLYNLAVYCEYGALRDKMIFDRLVVPGMTGPPNSFTARGPVTLTAILFTQPAV